MRFVQALIATLFLGCFIAVGVGVVVGVAVLPWLASRPYHGWQEAPCVVIESVVDTGGPEAPARLDLRFTFAWQGAEHVGTRLQPDGAPLTIDEMRQAAAEYPPGRQAACRFDPADPAGTAALDVPTPPGIPEVAFLCLWGAFFAGIPGFMLIMVWRRTLAGGTAGTAEDPAAARSASLERTATGRITAAKQAMASAKAARTGSATRLSSLPEAPGGGYQLATGFSSIVPAIVIGFFALFWNGITWFAVWSIIHDESGIMRIGLLAFLSIFVLVGLAMGGAFVYQLVKALFTPRVALRLSKDRLVLGQPTELRWSIERGRERLQDLRIELVLREESTYRRGTDTLTDRHEVLALDLWTRTEPDAEGRCTVTPPAAQPASLDGAANRLVWTVRVRGSVAGLPDVDDEHPLTVDPVRAVDPALAADGAAVDGDGDLSLDAEGAVEPGSTVRGSVRLEGEVELTLVRTTTGKGDTEREEVASAVVHGPGGFLLTAPTRPTTWPGTVVGVRWTLEADGIESGHEASIEVDIR